MAGWLDLTERKAFRYLSYLRDNLPSGCSVKFDAGIPAGIGKYKYDGRNMDVGVKGMAGRGLKMFAGVSDYLFTSAVVAMYHEYGHYLDDTDPSTPKEVILSAISTFNNSGYRLNGWKEFPHEISAERTGVLMAYDAMEGLFGETGKECVIDYVKTRIRDTAYLLRDGDVGEWTRDGLDAAFDTAMERSLETEREQQPGLRRYDTDVMTKFFLSPDGKSYFEKFNKHIPGRAQDRMAASVVIHFDPGCMDGRLSPGDVDMKKAFGMSANTPAVDRLFQMMHKADENNCDEPDGPDF